MSFAMVDAIWKSLEKSHKIHMNKNPTRNLKTCILGKENLRNKTKFQFKTSFDNKVQYNPSKIHN